MEIRHSQNLVVEAKRDFDRLYRSIAKDPTKLARLGSAFGTVWEEIIADPTLRTTVSSLQSLCNYRSVSRLNLFVENPSIDREILQRFFRIMESTDHESLVEFCKVLKRYIRYASSKTVYTIVDTTAYVMRGEKDAPQNAPSTRPRPIRDFKPKDLRKIARALMEKYPTVSKGSYEEIVNTILIASGTWLRTDAERLTEMSRKAWPRTLP